MRINADTRTKTWSTPDRTHESFRPSGHMELVEARERVGGAPSDPALAARLFVRRPLGGPGPSSDGKDGARTLQQQVASTVLLCRRTLGLSGGQVFVQPGSISSSRPDAAAIADAVQVVLIDRPPSVVAFTREVELLAEEVATVLDQGELVCEIQRRGLVIETFAIRAR